MKDGEEKEYVQRRLWGILANTSKCDHDQLNDLEELDTQEAESFSKEMLALHSKFGFRVLGGCCGTDETHIEAIASGFEKL